LRDLKLHNVIVRYADGSDGLPEAAPFDGIIMAAAAPAMLPALREQLAPDGRMVLPVGMQEQWLYLIERWTHQGFSAKPGWEAVKFVPLLLGKA